MSLIIAAAGVLAGGGSHATRRKHAHVVTEKKGRTTAPTFFLHGYYVPEDDVPLPPVPYGEPMSASEAVPWLFPSSDDRCETRAFTEKECEEEPTGLCAWSSARGGICGPREAVKDVSFGGFRRGTKYKAWEKQLDTLVARRDAAVA